MIHELFFESQEELQAALESPQGQAAGEFLDQIAAGQLILLTVEHTEISIEKPSKHEREHHVDE